MTRVGENGSVLMEFIIVLPIYMLLFGFVFVAGEMSLETIHLDAAADRTLAFAADEEEAKDILKYFESVVSPHDARKSMERDKDDSIPGELKDFERARTHLNDLKEIYTSWYGLSGEGVLEASPHEYHQKVATADSSSDYSSWTWTVAAKVTDKYTLSPLTRGIVAYWYRENYLTEEGVDRTDDGVLDVMVGNAYDGGLRRYEDENNEGMVGKELRDSKTGDVIRQNGFYCLRKNPKADALRNYSAGELLAQVGDGDDDSYLWEAIAGDALAPTDLDEIKFLQNRDAKTGSGPSPVGAASSYSRNSDFAKWMP